MYRKTKNTAIAVTMAIGLLATLPVEAAELFTFDPDGNGSDASVIVNSFDWKPSSALAVDALPTTALGTPNTTLAHASLGNLIGADNNPITTTGLNSDYEITLVLGWGEIGTDVGFGNSVFSLNPSNPTNYAVMYWNAPKDANELAGSGFDNGTEILRGRVVAASGTFWVPDIDDQTDLDLSPNGNQYPGITTVRGSGGGMVTIAIDSYNTEFFPDTSTAPVNMDFNTSQITPYLQVDPSASFTAEGTTTTATIGPVNGASLPEYDDFEFQADGNSALNLEEIVLSGTCRMTGGNSTVYPIEGTDGNPTWSYQFEGPDDGERVTTGGQINAPSGLTPPRGHWEHTLHGGADGTFSFHVGTSSAPEGTQISSVECADPGWCVQARCAPFKQLFWTGIGNFANQHFDYDFGSCNVAKGNRGTQHFVKVMIGDFGENDRPTREDALVDSNPDSCDWSQKLVDAGYTNGRGPWVAADAVLLDSVPDDQFGYKGGQVCDKCPDYYQIEIHCDTDPGSDVIYSFAGYLGGGNYQIHPETGEQCPVAVELVPELFESNPAPTNNGKKK